MDLYWREVKMQLRFPQELIHRALSLIQTYMLKIKRSCPPSPFVISIHMCWSIPVPLSLCIWTQSSEHHGSRFTAPDIREGKEDADWLSLALNPTREHTAALSALRESRGWIFKKGDDGALLCWTGRETRTGVLGVSPVNTCMQNSSCEHFHKSCTCKATGRNMQSKCVCGLECCHSYN